MCRNIKTLFNFEPPATHAEIHASALQFVRKLSGFNSPSQANAEAFNRAVSEVSDGVVDVTPVAAVEGVVTVASSAEALGQTTAKAAPSAASRVASQRRPKRWLSRGLNTTGKLPPQIARTLSVLAPIKTHLSPARTHMKRGYLICPAWGPRDYHVSGTDFRTGAMGWSQLHGSACR